MLHWIFQSACVQQFVIGCMDGMRDTATDEADKVSLTNYMQRGDVSGLTWDLGCRLSDAAECYSYNDDSKGRATLGILRRAVDAELDAKEAARPRDIGDLHDAVSDMHAELDGEVCDAGQGILDAVHEIHSNLDLWIDCKVDQGRNVYSETDMSRALLSAMVTLVLAVYLSRKRYGWDSTIPKLKRFQVEAVTCAATELADMRREDMRRFPQLGWTADKIERLEYRMLSGIRPLAFYAATKLKPVTLSDARRRRLVQ